MENKDKFKIWSTKYALTSGIVEHLVEKCGEGMVKTAGSFSSGGGEYFYVEGKQWHRTLEQAKEYAETMRKKKIESLKKSIAKIEKLTF